MKQIPDAAVQAFRQSFESTDNNCETYQDVCKALTAAIPYISAPCAVEVVDRAKRIANIYRNKDDEKVIASFHKETARVIDELLSCVFTKPVDVAAVRRQAFEEGFENGVEQSLNALDAYDDITRNEAEQGIRKLKPDYRALSAEPVQGCGSE